jgi:RNA polymerase sigma-70 factor (ECF subfamily)
MESAGGTLALEQPFQVEQTAPMDASFKENLLACRDSAYHLALRMTCNEPDAEDVVQDAFVRAIRFSSSAPHQGTEYRKWFLHIVANAARDKYSSEARRRDMERSVTVQQVQSTLETQPLDLRETIAQLLNGLDEKFRLPIALHYEQGLTHAEAAEILKIPHSTVRVYAARGLEILREQLARRGHTTEAAVLIAALGSGGKLSAPAGLALAVEKIVAAGVTPAAKAVGAVSSALMWKLSLSAVVVAIMLVSGFRLFPNPPAISNRSNIPDVAVLSPPIVTKGDQNPAPQNKFAGILSTKLSINYQREFLKEVLEDLRERTGLHSISPTNIECTLLTLASKEISVKEVLDKFGAEGLEFAIHDNTVVFWKRSDDIKINELETKLKNGDVHARCEAVCDLAPVATRRACSLLLGALNDNDASVRMWATFSLSNYRQTLLYADPVAGLAGKLLKEIPPPGEYRSAVISLLGATHDPQVEGKLIELLGESDVASCETAAEALGDYHSEKALLALIKRIGDNDEIVRANVAQSLAMLGDDRALKPLLNLLNRSYFFISEAANIASFGWEKIEKELKEILAGKNSVARSNVPIVLAHVRGAGREQAYALLLTLLKDTDKRVRRFVVWGLGFAANPDAIADLTRFIDEEPDSKGKDLAFESIARLRTEAGTNWLFDNRQRFEKDAVLFGFVARALGDTRDARAIPILSELMRSNNPDLVRMAVQGLDSIRSDSVVDTIVAAAKGTDADASWNATIGLSRTHHLEVIDPLLGFLKVSPQKWMPPIAACCLRPYLQECKLSDREKIKAALDAYNEKQAQPKTPTGDF